MQDIRHAFRALVGRPSLLVVAVLTMALGIGGNTAVFTVVNAVLLRPLPFVDAGRLVTLTERTPNFPVLSVSWQNYHDWRDQARSFSVVAAYRPVNFTPSASRRRVWRSALRAARCCRASSRACSSTPARRIR